MTPNEIFSYAGTGAVIISASAVLFASFKTNTAQVWRAEAEAQKTRADRLQRDMEEIKERLTRIEAENQRLIELLTALDPERLRALRI